MIDEAAARAALAKRLEAALHAGPYPGASWIWVAAAAQAYAAEQVHAETEALRARMREVRLDLQAQRHVRVAETVAEWRAALEREVRRRVKAEDDALAAQQERDALRAEVARLKDRGPLFCMQARAGWSDRSGATARDTPEGSSHG